jgi:hypothetical protein
MGGYGDLDALRTFLWFSVLVFMNLDLRHLNTATCPKAQVVVFLRYSVLVFFPPPVGVHLEYRCPPKQVEEPTTVLRIVVGCCIWNIPLVLSRNVSKNNVVGPLIIFRYQLGGN